MNENLQKTQNEQQWRRFLMASLGLIAINALVCLAIYTIVLKGINKMQLETNHNRERKIWKF